MSNEINIESLLSRLRAVSDTGCDPDLPHEAADVIETLQRDAESWYEQAQARTADAVQFAAERDAITQRAEDAEQLATARGHTIHGLRYELSEVNVERDALAAKLAELEGQEPVGKIIHAAAGPSQDGFYRHVLLSHNRLEDQHLYARPVPAEPVNARLLGVATGKIPHIYSENCPDPVSWPNSRDPECPACQAIIAAESQAGPLRLTDGWISVADAMPNTQQLVDIAYIDHYGRHQTTMGWYCRAKTLESSSFDGEVNDEYDEDSDAFYLKEQWVDESQESEYHYPINNVTHWKPRAKHPDSQPQAKGD